MAARLSSSSSSTGFILTAGKADLIKLNVGGREFTTTRSTLMADQNSLLSKMVEQTDGSATKVHDGAYFIDRSPKYFEIILNFLRSGEIEVIRNVVDLDVLLKEAMYYNISSMIPKLTKVIKKNKEETRQRRYVLILKMINLNFFFNLSVDKCKSLKRNSLPSTPIYSGFQNVHGK